MSLFKNKVGRPTNESLKRKRKLYILITIFSLIIVESGALFAMKTFSDGSIIGKSKNAAQGYTLQKVRQWPPETVHKYNPSATFTFKYTGPKDKMYYRVTTYTNTVYGQKDPAVSTGSCKSIKWDRMGSADINVSSKKVQSYVKVSLYTDKKCSTKAVASLRSSTYVFDNKAVKVVNACQKGGYVYVTANDNYAISKVAWIQRGQLCKKIVESAKTDVGGKKQLNNFKLPIKLNTTSGVKVCIWDYAGNEEAQVVAKSC